MGYVVNRIGKYRILEGIGRYGGFWFVLARGELARFNCRIDAEEHAFLESGMA